jgi:hypothetical protein
MTYKEHNQKENTASLSTAVLERIARERVTPRSRFLCRCVELSMWCLWAVTIMLGALMFAEVVYVAMHSGVEFYELTHDSFASFLIASLPVIWITVFGVFAILAVYHMRLTKRGYRYSLISIVGSSIVFTVVLGLFFNMLGVGKKIDMLLDTMPMPYESMEDRQLFVWTDPEHGRLAGMMISFVGTTTDIIFRDVHDREWIVSTIELSKEDFDLLSSGAWVRIFGAVDGMEGAYLFFVCSVHDWMYDDDMPLAPMKENKMHLYENKVFHEDKAKVSAEEEMRCSDIISDLMPK